MRREGFVCGDRRKCYAGPEHSDKKRVLVEYKLLACRAYTGIMQFYNIIKLSHMNILIIHQNFPGQYKHLSPALVRRGDRVVALTPKVKERSSWQGVDIVPYKIVGSSSKEIHSWLRDLETKVIRAESCFNAAMQLRDQGFSPDVILAHHGWGEPMFLKDVWPMARIGIYCEYYYGSENSDTAFDPEFCKGISEKEPIRLRLRNLNNTLHFDIAAGGISPTLFQANTFPPSFRDKIHVIHDGIDTAHACPNPDAKLVISQDLTLSRTDEVISFVNRNLEPYRGCHTFFRALPKILRNRPNAHIVVVGGDGASYGGPPPDGTTWKQRFIDEVRADISDTDWQRVHFTGLISYDKFISLLQVSRAHIYLTYPFVLSWSLLETMSAGGAILASDTAPVREVIFDDETGLLTDFFDTDALADNLNRLLDDAGLRSRLGAAARQLVLDRFDLEKTCLPQQLQWVDALAQTPAHP